MINPIYKKKKEITDLEQKIQLLYKQLKYAECITACERLASVYSAKSELVYLHLAKCYMNQRNYLKSKQSFLYLAELFPTNREAFINLGRICSECREYDEAKMYFSVYSDLIESDKDTNNNRYIRDKVSVLFNQANVSFELNDDTSAEAFLTQLLELNAQHSSGLALLGDVHFRNNKNEEALQCYNECFKLDKASTTISFKISQVYVNQAQFDLAVAQLELCIALNNHYLPAYKELGKILHTHLKKLEEALFNYSTFISLNVNKANAMESHEVYLAIGSIHEELYKSADAIVAYQKAFDLNKDNIVPLERIAQILFDKRKKYEEASEVYRQIISIKPSSKQAFIALGKCYFQLGKYDKSIEVYMNELLLDPYNSETFAAIAVCHQKRKHYKQADTYFRLSLQINPYDKDVLRAQEELKQEQEEQQRK